jgi:hypothetical protein
MPSARANDEILTINTSAAAPAYAEVVGTIVLTTAI